MAVRRPLTLTTWSGRLDHVRVVNLYEAKTHLSRLVEAASRGENIAIARNGKPLVRLVPIEPRRRSDAFGMDRGLVNMSADFDELPADFAEYVP